MKLYTWAYIIFFGMACVCAVFIVHLSKEFRSDEQPSSTLFERKETYAGPYLTTAPWDRGMFESMYTRASGMKVDVNEEIRGGIVPHHLLAGHLDALFFESLKKQHPSTIVIIGPDHMSRNLQPVATAVESWHTPLGDVEADRDAVTRIASLPFVSLQPGALSEEHSVYGLIPFVRESLPGATIIPLTLRHDISTEQLLDLRDMLVDTLPKDAVIVASVDFSHYQTSPVAEFHDERTIDVIRSFDYDRVDSLEIDSPASVSLLLRLMDAYGTKRIVHEEHINASEVVGNPDALDITSYYVPFFTKGESEQSRSVSMLSVGDIMIDRQVAQEMGTKGLPHILTTLAGTEGRFFRGIDIVAGNLEGPFVVNRIATTKEIAFRFDPRLALQLASFGFNLFTLANNHMFDMGVAGLPETVRVLDDAGIESYGHPYTVSTSSLLYKEVDGLRIAFLGFNDTFHSLDEDVAVDLITQAEQEADVTVLNIHWGVEYKDVSHPRQQYLAHKFVDAGVDLIIGHHPHVVEELEIYNNRPIFYSLGNFIFDQYFSAPTQESLTVGTVFRGDEGISLYLFPLVGKRSVLRQMSADEQKRFMSAFVDRSVLGTYTFDRNNHMYIPFSSN